MLVGVASSSLYSSPGVLDPITGDPSDGLTVVGRLLIDLFSPVQTVLAQENNVPLPSTGPFQVINTVTTTRLSGNRHTINPDGSQTITQPVEVSIQVDFYGDGAQQRQSQFVTIWRDAYAFDWMANNGFAARPLYATERYFREFVNESQNYEQRWTVEARLQIDQTVIVPVGAAIHAGTIAIVEVDTHRIPERSAP